VWVLLPPLTRDDDVHALAEEYKRQDWLVVIELPLTRLKLIPPLAFKTTASLGPEPQ
jgi:hypothetical protein